MNPDVHLMNAYLKLQLKNPPPTRRILAGKRYFYIGGLKAEDFIFEIEHLSGTPLPIFYQV
jgi:hypothetical protein